MPEFLCGRKEAGGLVRVQGSVRTLISRALQLCASYLESLPRLNSFSARYFEPSILRWLVSR